MMEQLLVAMDGMQEALTALQESRLGGERTAHDHSRTLQDLKVLALDGSEQRGDQRPLIVSGLFGPSRCKTFPALNA